MNQCHPTSDLSLLQPKQCKTAAIEASRLRLRPILMTAFSFILGLVPLVAATGAEMRRLRRYARFQPLRHLHGPRFLRPHSRTDGEKTLGKLIRIREKFDLIGSILVASVFGTGAIRIDPETEFRSYG